jgi:hypothetical protein
MRAMARFVWARFSAIYKKTAGRPLSGRMRWYWRPSVMRMSSISSLS